MFAYLQLFYGTAKNLHIFKEINGKELKIKKLLRAAAQSGGK